MRILAIYHDHDEPGEAKWEEIDVANEVGYWRLSNLLASGHVDEVRLVGDHLASIALARTLVAAGQYSRQSAPDGGLRQPGDEAYPFRVPFIYICPRPDPAAFD